MGIGGAQRHTLASPQSCGFHPPPAISFSHPRSPKKSPTSPTSPRVGTCSRTSAPPTQQPKALDCCQHFSSLSRTKCACQPLSDQAPKIGSPWRNCARQGSHTTGRAVFRIRRLNTTAGLTAQGLMVCPPDLQHCCPFTVHACLREFRSPLRLPRLHRLSATDSRRASRAAVIC